MATEKLKFQLYNSLSKQKEVFKPKIEGKVGMYVCGVTSYDFSHIGHARAYVAFDVLYRYLKYLGYDVTYVRNFTDVDDKIIRRANEIGENPKVLSSHFCNEFLIDMEHLHCLVPTHQPRVTEHMQQIKDMIAQIISNDCAYAVDGDVYFSVDNFPNYGLLSGRKLEDNRAGERVAVDERKRNPADFALWKAAKPGEPFWDSPWGPGRPGWHIECSAMSAEYLTHTFDIHGGGMDLIFPHHENEIAQSCAASSESKVNYWVHNGFVTANDEKMSKSLGNFFTIREVTNIYHPLALRYFLLGTHYRSPVNYSIYQIEIASEAIFYLYQTLLDCENAVQSLSEDARANVKTAGISALTRECINKLHTEFETKMSDDLHTPTILNSSLQETLRYINSSKKQSKQQQLSTMKSLVDLEEKVREVLDVLGLLSKSSYTEVLEQLKDKALRRASLTEEDILHSIEERMIARKNKEFSKSDQIRFVLAAKGIALMDIGKETVWRPCVPVQGQSDVSAQSEEPSLRVQQTNSPLESAPAAETAPTNPLPAENAPAKPLAENAHSVSPVEE
ncbi:cysteine--tRNA ligase-like [Dorcoceras hygrometricum]|uniref:cysteine--tRNA ligase n=1 Tax=Dorcoceras hygrometricum TaxID=472368 RepID=A0A2Z7A7J7_9LAMI|nr:cysteine--tRNA ligase-like [Dorcoceras hygrometricum]